MPVKGSEVWVEVGGVRVEGQMIDHRPSTLKVSITSPFVGLENVLFGGSRRGQSEATIPKPAVRLAENLLETLYISGKQVIDNIDELSTAIEQFAHDLEEFDSVTNSSRFLIEPVATDSSGFGALMNEALGLAENRFDVEVQLERKRLEYQLYRRYIKPWLGGLVLFDALHQIPNFIREASKKPPAMQPKAPHNLAPHFEDVERSV